MTSATPRRFLTVFAMFALMAVCMLFGMESAFAQADVTAITGALSDAEGGVTTVSGGMLGIVGAGLAVKWILGFLIS